MRVEYIIFNTIYSLIKHFILTRLMVIGKRIKHEFTKIQLSNNVKMMQIVSLAKNSIFNVANQIC